MKTRLAILLGSLLLSSAAYADRALTTGPDFVGSAPKRHIDQSLVASPTPERRIDPTSVVAFEHDESVLTSDGYSQVDTAAAWLKRNPRHMLVLEGHADALGSSPYNEDLATRRMVTIRERMRRQGVSPDRIMLITYGEREALDAENPLHGADRRVVMYATQLAPQAVAAMVRENREAIVATWSEGGAMMRLTHGLEQPERIAPAQTVRR
jgi:outer membrane protein OmpA-like peptidoglycan-associated protein